MSCRTIFPASREQLETAKSQLETAKAEAQKEFPQEKELAEKVARLGELNVLLDMDKKDRVVMEEEPETEEIEPEREKAAWGTVRKAVSGD